MIAVLKTFVQFNITQTIDPAFTVLVYSTKTITGEGDMLKRGLMRFVLAILIMAMVMPHVAFAATPYHNYFADSQTEPYTYSEDEYFIAVFIILHLPCTMPNPTPWLHLIRNRGDVVQRTNQQGNVLHSYRFSAFGVERNYLSTNTNPFRFAGELWDWERAELYLRARSFSPRLGRFTQPDPHWTIHAGNMQFGDDPIRFNQRTDRWGRSLYTLAPDPWAIMQSSNLFIYCLNNPVLFIDPSGRAVTTGGKAVFWGVQGIRAAWAARVATTAVVGYLTFDSIMNSPADIARMGSYAVRQDIGNIAGGFGNLQCVAAANAMQSHLTRHGRHGEVIILHFHDTYRGLVVSDAYMNARVAISENGMHRGIKYNGLVHCNVHPKGLTEAAWIASFITFGGGIPEVTRIPF